MPAREVLCPACRRSLPLEASVLAGLTQCPDCAAPIRIAVFPAFNRKPVTGQAAERITGEAEAACFFHVSKKASVPCDECGRFLCALCDFQIDNRHLCPPCLEAAQQKRSITSLERTRTRWDIIAWAVNLAILTCIGAPVAALANLIITLLRWKAPGSRVANTRLRLILATLFAVAAATLTGLSMFGGIG